MERRGNEKRVESGTARAKEATAYSGFEDELEGELLDGEVRSLGAFLALELEALHAEDNADVGEGDGHAGRVDRRRTAASGPRRSAGGGGWLDLQVHVGGKLLAPEVRHPREHGVAAEGEAEPLLLREVEPLLRRVQLPDDLRQRVVRLRDAAPTGKRGSSARRG